MADSEKRTKLIQEFRNVAGVNEERARFYLESSAWNIDAAVQSFYDNDDDGDMDVSHSPPHQAEKRPSPPPTKPSAKSSSGSQPAKSRFGTIGSLRKEDSDSSEEEGQAYYAGGSEHGGGQQIIGPGKKKPDANSIVSDVFRSAREHGAEEVQPSSSSGATRFPAFQGRAYRLGETSESSQVIEGSASQRAAPRQVDYVLKLWRNGFSVNDGPLRDLSDPESQKFLQSVKKGEIPQELIQQARGGTVNLDLEDHHEEDYVRPAAVLRPFTGEGHRLGCPTDSVTMATDAARSMSGTQPTSQSSSASVAGASASLNVDESQPTTSLQIRLADGSKLVAKFNHTHQVSDVRQFIVTARPQYGSANFVLMTTFPNAELTDETLTLAAAKLMNAVIVQRMK